MITTDHSHLDIILVFDSIHHTFNVISQWIFQSKSTKECEAEKSFIKCLLEFFTCLLELGIVLILIHFIVSEGNHSQSFLRHILHYTLNLVCYIVAQAADIPVHLMITQKL